MPLNSNRLGIADALVALAAGIQNPNTNQPVYQGVKLGSIFNPTNWMEWCEITFYQGKGGPEGSGGAQIGWRVGDDVTYQMTSGFGPYETDSTASERAMLTAHDIVLPTLRKHFQLPDASNPTVAVQSAYSVLLEQVDRAKPVKFPNGHVYKLWDVFITVKQGYNVELAQP
jgi:hypothetical protein